jgi:acetyl-CoA C-acetyltransferase
MQKDITLEQVMSSRVIAWPIKMLECALVSDGAGCLILAKPEIAREFTEIPVDIIGSGQASDTINLCERKDFTSLRVGNLAGKEAYNMANIKPNDIDVAELHDCFTIAEIMACEDLGFCKRGKGGALVRDGITSIGGKIPINTSGGLKAKGHPVGSTGTAQAYEIYLQLTEQAEKRQVKGAELGLSFNLGGSGATATVHIFKRR